MASSPLLGALRTAALVLGYTLPMILLLVPVQIPARFLWVGVAEHRGLADTLILLACPALVWLAQTHWSAAAGRQRAPQQPDEIVSLDFSELHEATDGFGNEAELGRGGFGVVYGRAARWARSRARGAALSSGCTTARPPPLMVCAARFVCSANAATRTCFRCSAFAWTAARSASSTRC